MIMLESTVIDDCIGIIFVVFLRLHGYETTITLFMEYFYAIFL